jgi:hypothetical protein
MRAFALIRLLFCSEGGCCGVDNRRNRLEQPHVAVAGLPAPRRAIVVPDAAHGWNLPPEDSLVRRLRRVLPALDAATQLIRGSP